MKSDYDMIIHKIETQDDLTIFPIADLHIGAREFNEKRWQEFIKEINETPNSYIILGGDLINNSTKSSVANIFEETIRPREQKRIVAEMLEPIKEKILCMVSGNHERRSKKDADDDPSYDIACKLDIEDIYRENLAIVKIQVKPYTGHHNPTYVLAVTHGNGGGMYTGANVNRQENYGRVFDGIDALISGHAHKPFVSTPVKINVDVHNNAVTTRPFFVVSMTSWLDYGGYAMQKQLLPSGISPQKMVLECKKKKIKVTI